MILQGMGVQLFHGEGPHPLLRTGLPAACRKMTINDTPNRLN